MSLPSNYRQLAYIESSGKQYVDTGFVPNQDTRVVAKVYFPATLGSSGTSGLFGVRPSSVTNAFEFSAYSSYYRTFYGSSIGSYATSVNKTSVFVLDKNKNITTLDGANTDTRPTATFTASGSIYIFAVNTVSAANYYTSAKVYEFKIYDNGTLVRDYIPCETNAGEVGLWDDVEGKFYGNAGTGTFIKGKYVVREGEFEELEYLQSSGTQYVDTGFVPNQDTRVYAECVLPIASANQGLFGCRVSSSSRQFQFVTQGGYYRTDYNTAIANFASTDYGSTKFYVDKNKNITDLNGNTTYTHTYASFTCPGNMFVFATNNNGSVYAYATAKLYTMQIYDNGLLERDYVPIRYLPTGELGLLDKVYGLFYPNAGSGTFTAGDVVESRDYTEVEYIQSSGKQYINTGFAPNNKTRTVATFAIPTFSTGNLWLFGSRETASSGRYSVYAYNGSSLRFGYDTGIKVLTEITAGTVYTVDLNGNVGSVGGTSVSATASTFQNTKSLYLCSENLAGNPGDGLPCQLYSCQIYDSGLLERDYIPKVHPSGVAGLWDSVNSRFYASATTADLIAGPEISREPDTPTGFRVVSKTDTSLDLAWNAVEDALGYHLYKDGRFLADLKETTYTDAVEPFASYEYSVAAYNENGFSDAAVLSVSILPENPTLYLITDRTQADVAARNTKGTYRADDLNRVNMAMDYLKALLDQRGYLVKVSLKTDWTDSGVPYPALMEQYLDSLSAIRDRLVLFESTPEAPKTIEKFNYTKANDIEQILLDVYALLVNMPAVYRHSGVTICGMGGLIL